MNTLIEISQKLNEIEEKLYENTGELLDEMDNVLTLTSQELTQKLGNYSTIMKHIEMRSEHYDEMAKSFRAKAKDLNQSLFEMRERIKQVMITLNKKELQGTTSKFVLSQAKSTMIIDEEKLPNAFKIVSYSPDKTKIAERIAQGTEIPGVHIEPSYSLREYFNLGENNDKT